MYTCNYLKQIIATYLQVILNKKVLKITNSMHFLNVPTRII